MQQSKQSTHKEIEGNNPVSRSIYMSLKASKKRSNDPTLPNPEELNTSHRSPSLIFKNSNAK